MHNEHADDTNDSKIQIRIQTYSCTLKWRYKEYIDIIIIEKRHIDLNNNNWPFEPWTADNRQTLKLSIELFRIVML